MLSRVRAAFSDSFSRFDGITEVGDQLVNWYSRGEPILEMGSKFMVDFSSPIHETKLGDIHDGRDQLLNGSGKWRMWAGTHCLFSGSPTETDLNPV